MARDTFTITVEDGRNAAAEDIVRGLIAWNAKVTGGRERECFSIVLRDVKAHVIGGVNAIVSFEALFIDDVWIADDLRGNRIGTQLMEMAEQEGRRRGATLAWLDTMSWQARPFYERLGYSVCGELTQAPSRYRRYFMQKAL